MKKILFILKKRHIYSDDTYSTVNSGLYNSAMFVNDMLLRNGVDSTLIQVVDNNEIDKYCHQIKPDVVIIEALWVTPSKFAVLQKLHPNITWVIRLHSELPFLANEGIAIEWLKEYVKYDNVVISANSKYLIKSLEPYLKTKMVYTPNYYKVAPFGFNEGDYDSHTLNIGLFGAVRPLKNTLTQAVAAINYADKHGKRLKLHINSARIEQKGENVLKNLRALFVDTDHELVEHGWLSHRHFLLLISTMDLCMQISLSETYNIVAADSINVDVPIVASKEITFVNPLSSVGSNKDTDLMVRKMEVTLRYKMLTTFWNKLLLKINSCRAQKTWLDFVKR